ncbi:MAG: peptidylprolyl isomerase, partial [Dokdonella sp.]
ALFTREGGLGIAANADVVKAAFSDQVLVQGNNSDAISLGQDHVAVIRVAEHKPSTPRPLDDVRSEITQRILAARTGNLAKLRADELFARVLKGESLDTLASELKLEVKQHKSLGRSAVSVDTAIRDAVFAMARPSEGKSEFKLVGLADNGHVLVALDRVEESDPTTLDAPTREAAKNTLQQTVGYQSATDFIAALRASMEIVVAEDRL